MKTMMKHYRVFLSGWYQALILVISPLVWIALTVLFEKKLAGSGAILVLMAMFFLELVADYWVFGGICSKEQARLDYLKSSFYGKQMIKDGVIVDLVRHFVWMLLVVTISRLYCNRMEGIAFSGHEMVYILDTTLIGYVLFVVCLNFTRYVEMFQPYMFFCSLCGSLCAVAEVLFWMLDTMGQIRTDMYVWLTGILIVLSIGFTVFHIWHVMVRVNNSYFDS